MKYKDFKKICCCLEISSFTYIGSLGAEHYYGSLYCQVGDKLQIRELEYEVDEQTAQKLNKNDGYVYEVGEKTIKFFSEEEVKDAAIRQFSVLFPTAKILINGSYAVADPQEVLVGPEPFKKEANQLVRLLDMNSSEAFAHKAYKKYRALIDDI